MKETIQKYIDLSNKLLPVHKELNNLAYNNFKERFSNDPDVIYTGYEVVAPNKIKVMYCYGSGDVFMDDDYIFTIE